MVELHDFPCDGETDAGAFIRSVQALEDGEYFLCIFFFETDAVVGECYPAKAAFRVRPAVNCRLINYVGCNRNVGLNAGTREFKSVAEDVLALLAKKRGYNFKFGDFRDFYGCLFVFDREFQIVQNVIDNAVYVCGFKSLRF